MLNLHVPTHESVMTPGVFFCGGPDCGRPWPCADTPDCPGCHQPIETAGYDAGCNYMCTKTACSEHLYCTESCADNANERAAERQYEDFHGGSGPLPIDEQCRRAYAAKEGR